LTMRIRKVYITFLAIILLFNSISFFAYAASKLQGAKGQSGGQGQSEYTVISSYRNDINFDGAEEEVFLIQDKKKQHYIKINKVTMKLPSQDVKNLSFLELPRNSVKLILIEIRIDDKPSFVAFFYNTRNIQQVAKFSSHPAVDSDGLIYTEENMGFWIKKDKYMIVDSKEGKTLKAIPQELYYVGFKSRVKGDIILYANREENSKLVVDVLRSGDNIEILLCDPSNWFKRPNQKNNRLYDWYLVKTDKGFIGWTRYKDLQQNVEGI